MMEMCGYNARYHHLLQMGNYPWYYEYTCTPQEEKLFKEWYIKERMKELKGWHKNVRRRIAEGSYSWFWLDYGLRTVGT